MLDAVEEALDEISLPIEPRSRTGVGVASMVKVLPLAKRTVLRVGDQRAEAVDRQTVVGRLGGSLAPGGGGYLGLGRPARCAFFRRPRDRGHQREWGRVRRACAIRHNRKPCKEAHGRARDPLTSETPAALRGRPS